MEPKMKLKDYFYKPDREDVRALILGTVFPAAGAFVAIALVSLFL